jgi:hypothetical protein
VAWCRGTVILVFPLDGSVVAVDLRVVRVPPPSVAELVDGSEVCLDLVSEPFLGMSVSSVRHRAHGIGIKNTYYLEGTSVVVVS